MIRTKLALTVLLGLAMLPAAARAQAGPSGPIPGLTPADSSFRATLGQYETALLNLFNSNDTLWLALSSHSNDVTLLDPFGGISRGWEQVGAKYAMVASRYEPGNAQVSVEYIAAGVSGGMAYVVAVERGVSRRRGEAENRNTYVRATSVFRLEEGRWRLLHRHMDHLTPAS